MIFDNFHTGTDGRGGVFITELRLPCRGFTVQERATRFSSNKQKVQKSLWCHTVVHFEGWK